MLDVGLHLRIIELATDEALRVENAAKGKSESQSKLGRRKVNLRVVRVHGDLVLGSIADETLALREGDIRRRGAVTLVVGNDLNTIVLPDTDTSEKTAVSIWFAGIEVTQKNTHE